MSKPYKILHTADIQVRVREIDLGPQYEAVLREIEGILTEREIEVYLLAGDLAEYAASNDAEKKIIYEHLSRVLAIPTIREMVVMNGNHDLHDMRKVLSSSGRNNAMDTFASFVRSLDPVLSKKVLYLKEQRVYPSQMPGLSWVSYSLEGGSSAGSNLDLSTVPQGGLSISVYHDVLREYADQAKLPVRGDKYERLASVEDFVTPLVLAGDIHVNWECSSTKGTRFMYPGSPIQRNHSEGSYFRVRRNYREEIGAQKVVKLVTVRDGCQYEIEDAPLTNWVSYVTIDMTTNQPVENHMFQLKAILGVPGIWGVGRTFIKFKLSTSYQQYEMAMVVAATEAAAQRQGETKIDVAYDKFVMADSGESLLPDGEGDGDGDGPSMDDLILDDKRLAELFARVLETQKGAIAKEFADEGETRTIMESVAALFAEQLQLAFNSTPNYSVEFDQIECTCFMALGKNKIDLNIPGLTRITGTNGIGKTTLYNMMRWAIRNEIMENMPKGAKVKNALHLFNDSLPETDTSLVRLTFRANGTRVQVSRWATRVWKATATAEQKAGRQWKSHVANVNQGLKLQVFKDGAVSTEKIGDEAQKLLDRWFGSVPNTIMILNQQKILNMLNMPAGDLTQLVLDYIGVDYLNALENNLGMVKDTYETARPARTKQQIKEAVLQCGEDRRALNERLGEVSERLAADREAIAGVRLHMSHDRKTQLEMGDVPNLIATAEQEAEELRQSTAAFKPAAMEPEPVFTEPEPIQPDTREADRVAVEKEAAAMKGEGLKADAAKAAIEAEWLAVEGHIKGIAANTKKAILSEFSAIVERYQEIKKSDIERHSIACDLYSKSLRTMSNSLGEKAKEANAERDTAQKRLAELSSRSIELHDQIEGGTCPKCKRPLSEDPEHWAEMVKSMEAELEAIKPEKELLRDGMPALLQKADALAKYVSAYEHLTADVAGGDYSRVAANNPNYSNTVAAAAALVTDTRNQLAVTNDVIACAIDNRLSPTVAGCLGWDAILAYRKELDEIAPRLEAAIRRDRVALVALDATGLFTARFDRISELLEFRSAFEEQAAAHYKMVQEIAQKGTEAQAEYTQALKRHQDAMRVHASALSEARERNRLASERNRAHERDTDRLRLEEARLEKLRLELPTWDKTVASLEAHALDEERLQAAITSGALEEQSITDRATGLDEREANENKAMEDYVVWQRKAMIFKVYQALIRKDFRDIIFNYYREFLNGTLNILLEGLSFKLYWDTTGELYMVELRGGHAVYRPVQLVSGMETSFQGLALIYSIHLLNVKNSISTIFIDEISGQLNTGKELANKTDIVNYQEKLLLLLSRFDKKNLFIIDHVIDNMYETQTYQVVPTPEGSKYVTV